MLRSIGRLRVNCVALRRYCWYYLAFSHLMLLGMQIRLNMGEKSAHFSLLGLRPRPRTRREAVGGVEKPTPPTGR